MLKTGIGILFFWVLVFFENPHFSAYGAETGNDQVRNSGTDFHFPAAGKSIENQERRTPQQVGLDSGIAGWINQYIAEN